MIVALAVMILPGAAAGAIVVIAFRPFIGAAALIPAAAVCGAIVLAEVLMAIEAIAPAYERMDLVSVERGRSCRGRKSVVRVTYRMPTNDYSYPPLAGLWSEYRGTECPSSTSVVL